MQAVVYLKGFEHRITNIISWLIKDMFLECKNVKARAAGGAKREDLPFIYPGWFM